MARAASVEADRSPVQDEPANRTVAPVSVVSICPVDGVFPSRAYAFEGADELELGGNAEPCPTCGRESAVMDGIFRFDDEGLTTVLSAPDWSVQALRSVQEDLGGLRSALEDPKATPAEVDRAVSTAAEKLSARDEELARVIINGVRGKPRPVALAMVMILYVILDHAVTLEAAGQLAYETLAPFIRQLLG